MTIQSIAGIIVPLLIFVSEWMSVRGIFVPDRLSGEKVRPSRSTFWILTVLHGMLAVSYFKAGGGLAAGLSAAYAVAFLPSAILSIRYGYSRWSQTDTVCLVGAAVAGSLWWYTGVVLGWSTGESALLATILLLLTQFLGIFPTIMKVRVAPFTENRNAWMLTVVASLVNVLTVETWGTVDYLYAAYMILENGLVTYYIWRPLIQGRFRGR
ncbi:hypothetical protein A2856_00320 [Candidatus Uhrbacteria bacterium RIFCSPHIGHO2_01_FULL_63_20]|uniref:Uncharacterized protein n=1 Tax=Candidatus Uhrbacteria bacterium RIFCSPHIGHO2_01_FULL_63_20 TaxID=1802385 RepID=A0A1F7TLT2_9BACT|nr:MAG: hypothetical protein A2856_00320 [Candidatus Uhrbacteria bacterium RIFCSPHIGHO2_01_FULL_63_20]